MHLNCFFSPCKQSDVDIITVRGKYKNTMPTFDLYLKKPPKTSPRVSFGLCPFRRQYICGHRVLAQV